jgi:beta-N-acetylhexosaminidase
MKILAAFFGLLVALALLPFALDWRSPLLFSIRPLALMGLIAVPLGLIAAQAWILRTSRPGQRGLRAVCALGLLTATLVLISTAFLEARFHWVRHVVLHTDPNKLEKLGRHLIVGYRDPTEVRELVKIRAVGGVFLSTHNVRGKSLGEIRHEMEVLQHIRLDQGLPRMWIATDQEGGVVSRLSPPLPRQPPLSEIVERFSDKAELKQAVLEYARKQGRCLAQAGVNLNFAPVVDLNYRLVNPDDQFTRIYRRAISSDPNVVTQVAGWYCAALEEAGVRCTLKHFPGLGRVFEDTHRIQGNLATTVEELTATDWIPFRKLMQGSRAFTMLGHVRLKAVDDDLPASVSTAVVAGVIRGAWNYDGVLITDNFTMGAMYRNNCGIDEGSILALNAGVDLILISYDVDQYYRVMHALLKADRQGRLDQEALLKSEQRLARSMRTLHHNWMHAGN